MAGNASGVLRLIAVMIVILATGSARAQSWNLYSGSTSSVTIPFASGPMSATQDATLSLTLGGTTLSSVPMDTGSNGILISASKFTPTSSDQYLGPGTETLTSSKITYNGNLYSTTVTINSGTSAVATATVTVLQVTSITSASCQPSCPAPDNIAYMGVGFNRNVSTVTATTPGVVINTNPFINLTSINGQPTTSLQQGYIITNSGVTLGLTAANTQNFAFVKLVPDTSPSPNSQAGTVWQQAPATVVVNGVAGSGTILPDSGIAYSYLTPPRYVGVGPCATTPPGGSSCLPSSVTVEVYLPGQTTPQLATYTLTDSGSPLAPAAIALNPPSSTTFLNTGRLFYQGFDYLYDPTNGYVGYASASSYASVTAMVALIGNVNLPDGFNSSLQTYLFGATTLLEKGTGTITSVIGGSGGLTIGGGTMILQGVNTYTGGTTVTGGATLGIPADSALGDTSGGLTLNNGTLLLQGGFTTARAITLGSGGGTLLTGGNTFTAGQGISGPGGLTVGGGGQVILGAANSYTGPTTVNAGTTLALTGAGSIASSSGLTSNGTFDISGATSSTVSLQSLAGSGTVTLGSRSLAITNGGGTFSGAIGGSGGLTVSGGFLGLSGSNTYTGPTSVTGGGLTVNGSITSAVTVAAGASLGGSGQITGNVVSNGQFAPGSPFGTMTVNGTLTLGASSSHFVSLSSTGQIGNATISGTASLQGGTVSVAPTPGLYALRTTYNILKANGGLSGTYSSVTSSLPFLLPSLSYDANNAYVTLEIGGFQKAAQTPAQAAVAAALNANAQSATGDFATVMSAFSSLSTGQMAPVLNALSGQNYAAFSTSMTQSAQMFMNNFLAQAGGGSRGSVGGSGRIALAEACDAESEGACDATEPAKWGAWGGGVGGVGTVGAGTSTGAVTYNLGGFAAGLDRQLTDTFLAGVAVGYTSGQQWVSGLAGTGLSDSYQASLYASYSDGPAYADGMAGYAYSSNRMWRTIAIPGLATRTAQATTGANQFFGQVEGGWRFAIGATGDTTLAPFARLQGSTTTQNGFTETGAQSLDLTVAPQTANSLRSVLGAQLGGTADLGWRGPLALQVKLGWSHEYASLSLPVTATLAGAPATSFTTYGVSPKRDGVLVGMNGSTAIARATSVYARYEGLLSGSDSSHAITAGVRMTW
ncbi:MAG: autotransporter domain-containing protein [Proteobacteria bacterium]|nr:autotransporter domain-containing protein [Pseudomonadota bacterium]